MSYSHMLACRRLCRGVDAEVYAVIVAEGAVAGAGAHVRHCFKVTFLLIISNNLESLFIDDTIPTKFYRASSVQTVPSVQSFLVEM